MGMKDGILGNWPARAGLAVNGIVTPQEPSLKYDWRFKGNQT